MSHIIDPRSQSRGQGDATPAGDRAPASADSAAFATVYNDVRRPSHSFLRPPVEADEIGRLGSYRILRLLGQGGMGFVFHAEDAALRRPVALKVMRPELEQDEDGLERFLREARLMASIKHDHLVTVYQVGQEGRLPYLAMELLQGESLDHWMKQSRKVSVSDVLRLSREIVSGLAVIHRHGLIHRDVKPANIWLESPGGRVKILDFGLARIAKDEARLTQPGMVLGTPAFMAPEQARGESVDARGDLFSLGCILYELSSGTRPFEAPTTMAALTALAVKDPKPLHELRSSLPRDLSDLIMQLLAKDPAPARVGSGGAGPAAEDRDAPGRPPGAGAGLGDAPRAAAAAEDARPGEEGQTDAPTLAEADAGGRAAAPRRADHRLGPARPDGFRPAEPGGDDVSVSRFCERLDADRRPESDLGPTAAAGNAAAAARRAAAALRRRPGPR